MNNFYKQSVRGLKIPQNLQQKPVTLACNFTEKETVIGV